MEKEVRRLKEELDKVYSQLYIFYELTKAMRTTLRLDEITYIILTGLTAHEGLRFNRAAIFFIDEPAKKIKGFMGIGPIDAKEAGEIWKKIEEEKKDLYGLIDNYHHIKKNMTKSKFMELVQSLSFSINDKNNLMTNLLNQKIDCHIKIDEHHEMASDPLVKKLNLSDFLISPLKIKDRLKGIMIVDNYITKQPISKEDIKIFRMFTEQAAGAIENSQSFESTLIKAHTDSLTSLWNYGYFQYRLDEEILKAKSEKLSLSVMMIDVDDFKKFNDTFGHMQGDKALQQISRILRTNCRKIDILCRYGGEEFSLILPDDDKEKATLLGERIRKSIECKKILRNQFTVSIGISSYPQDASSKATLINKADQALYKAKRTGKNKVVLA